MIESIIGFLAGLSVFEALGVVVAVGVAIWITAARVYAAIKRVVVRFVMRHTAIAAIGFLGLSLEAFLPEGVAGALRSALSMIGLG